MWTAKCKHKNKKLFKFSCKINSASWGLQGYEKKNEGVNICPIFISSWKFNAQSGFLVLNFLLKFNRVLKIICVAL